MRQSSLFSFFRPQPVVSPQQSPETSAAPEQTAPTDSTTNQTSSGNDHEQDEDGGNEYAEEGTLLPEVKPYPTPNPTLTVVPVAKESIPQLKRLTGNLLAVKYPDYIFDEAWSVDSYRYLCRQVVITTPVGPKLDSPVGWIRCRLETFPMSTPPNSIDPQEVGKTTRPTQIYIQALCLLAPYRGYGAAAALLDALLSDKSVLKAWDVRGVYAHVWENNDEGLEWYKKRGFKQTILVDGYYRKLKPKGAWIVWLPLDENYTKAT